jgi:acyl-CoA hydrolase
MVAIGADGRPVPVPPWQPRTAEQRRRHAAAERRSRLRRDINRAGTEIKQTSCDDELASQG